MASCPRCLEGHILPGEPKGSIQPDFSGAYFSPRPTNSDLDSATAAPSSSKRSVLLFTDVFGLPLKNSKLIADALAERLDCDVWIPDYFNGQPLFPLNAMALPDRVDESMSTWKWVQYYFKNVLLNLPAFWKNRASVVDERVASFVSLIRSKKGYEKIGAVGYCFGGAVCVRAASVPNFLDGVVICHPGLISLAQVQAAQIPTSWVCAQVDEYFSDTLRDQCEAELAGRKGTDRFVDYEFKIYPGTTHGFACRPNLAYPDVVECHKQALDQTVLWFEKTLAL